MPLSQIITNLASAVAAEITTPTPLPAIGAVAWSRAMAVYRSYDAELKLEDAQSLRAHVVSGKVRSEVADRSRLLRHCDVIVYLRVQVDLDESDSPADTVAVDPFPGLLEEIDRHFFTLLRPPQFPQAIYESSEITPFSRKRIHEEQEYSGVVILTFSVWDN